MPTLEYPPADKPPLPTPLIVVASIFIFFGALGIMFMIVSAFLHRGLILDWISPFILIWGIGLLRRIPACHAMALCTLGADIALSPILFILLLIFHPGAPALLSLPALKLLLPESILLLTFPLSLWQYRTLRRPEIASLFKEPPRIPTRSTDASPSHGTPH